MKPPRPQTARKSVCTGLDSHPSTSGPVVDACPGTSEATVSILEDEGAGEGAAGSLEATPLWSAPLSLANLTWGGVRVGRG